MKRRQTGRTPRVNRHARPVQIIHVRNPITKNGIPRPSDGVLGVVLQVLVLKVVVIIGSGVHPTVNRRVRTPDRSKGDSRVFEGFVGYFQEETLLGVHRLGFFARDTKELGVKVGEGLVEKVAVLGVERAFVGVVWVVEGVDVESVGGHLALEVDLAEDVVPETGWGDGSGHPAGHADDGWGVGVFVSAGGACHCVLSPGGVWDLIE